MIKSEFIAKSDKYLRNKIIKTFPQLGVRIYSKGKAYFVNKFVYDFPTDNYSSKVAKPEILWDLKFNLPLFNSAGMFKKGLGYKLCERQGAGAFLAGTTTSKPRLGNIKNGISRPFIPLPKSNMSINWLGLPNEGHETVAKRLSFIVKSNSCPVGASLSADSDLSENEALAGLIRGLYLYEKAGVDFIEINESCPNVEGHSKSENLLDDGLIRRLEHIKSNFIDKQNRFIPLIVKFSTDTQVHQIPDLINLLIDMNYDGVNFGNTSTNYNYRREAVHESELAAFDYFTSNFGGGVSGTPLSTESLTLCKKANDIIGSKSLKKEFNLIRTGGISNLNDIKDSYQAGVKLNQWYTGYFNLFSVYGHKLYLNFFQK